MRYFILFFFVSLFTSCGVYQINTTPKVKISKVLTITSTGDTLAVPLRDFQKFNYNNVFDNYRWNFNYGFNYYSWGNPYFGYSPNWYRPNSWHFRDWYYTPPIYNYSLEVPQNNKPRVYVKGRRGSNTDSNRIIIKPNNNNNDQISGPNFRTPRSTEGSNNGRRSWSGEDIFVKPIVPRQPPIIQPGQVRRGSQPPVLQQPRSSIKPGSQGRSKAGRIQE
jgi:hypothetical protein